MGTLKIKKGFFIVSISVVLCMQVFMVLANEQQIETVHEKQEEAPVTVTSSEPGVETILGVDITQEPSGETPATDINSGLETSPEKNSNVVKEIPSQVSEMPDTGDIIKDISLPQEGKTLRLNFKDASVDSILQYLSEVAGLVVIRETTVEGRITVISRQPITVAEAVSLLNIALKEKGYAAISMGRTLKIVPLADAKKRNIPVRTGNNPAEIEPTDMVVTQIIPIRYLNVTQLKQDIAPLLPSYAELTANVSSNSLILTDTQANIRRIVEIVRALDTAVSVVSEVKVFQLKYANATNTAKLINDMFKIEQTTSTPGPQARNIQAAAGFFRGQTPQATSSSATSESGQPNVKVTASADDRTNTLVVSGPPDVLKVVEEVIKELDASPEEEQAVFIYSLKNGKAKNLETVLSNLFMTSTTGTTSTQQRFQRTVTGTTTISPAASQVASGLVGQVYVVAEEDTNSLMVMTASKNFDKVKEIIADLDRAVPQVLIKVLIAEVTHDKSLDLGTEFSLLNLTTDGNRRVFSNFDLSDKSTGLGIRFVEEDLSAAINALQKVGKLDVLSRPYILGSDNQAAKITVGQRVPFITNSRMTDTGQTINTIQYEDIGIILTVTPHINPAGLVILDVSPEISSLTGTTVPISETVNAPVFAKRAATSRVAIQDGQTIVIGGLMEDKKTEEAKKVPFLGDIPLVGTLFKRTTTENTKTELLIFLTPHVAAMPKMLSDISAGELQGTSIIPSSIKPGAFDKYMKEMERRGVQEK